MKDLDTWFYSLGSDSSYSTLLFDLNTVFKKVRKYDELLKKL